MLCGFLLVFSGFCAQCLEDIIIALFNKGIITYTVDDSKNNQSVSKENHVQNVIKRNGFCVEKAFDVATADGNCHALNWEILF